MLTLASTSGSGDAGRAAVLLARKLPDQAESVFTRAGADGHGEVRVALAHVPMRLLVLTLVAAAPRPAGCSLTYERWGPNAALGTRAVSQHGDRFLFSVATRSPCLRGLGMGWLADDGVHTYLASMESCGTNHSKIAQGSHVNRCGMRVEGIQ